MVGRLSKNVGHHDWATTKNKKKHWLKLPKAVPKKRNLYQNINDSLSHISGILFLKILFRTYLFSYAPARSSGHHQSLFINFRFSNRNSQSQQKLAKNITHFTKQFCSKNLTHFTNLNSTDIRNNMLLQHSQKPF